MSHARPDLSVVVVTHNGRSQAMETLRSARSKAGALDVEWFVVDSGSSDGTPEAVSREWSDIRIFRRTNIGFAAANNVALGHATGRYVLLLNPDVEITTGTLDDLVGALDRRPEVGAASVIQVDPEGRLLASVRRFPSLARKFGEALALGRYARLGEEVRPGDSYRVEHDADWVVGAFLVLRRKALQAIGPLDERFFLYSEEADICRRVWDAGWRVRHMPALTVTHACGGYRRPELRAQLSWSKLLFAKKHYGPARAGAMRAVLVLGHALRVIVFALPALMVEKRRARLRGEAMALGVLLRTREPPFRIASASPAERDQLRSRRTV